MGNFTYCGENVKSVDISIWPLTGHDLVVAEFDAARFWTVTSTEVIANTQISFFALKAHLCLKECELAQICTQPSV